MLPEGSRAAEMMLDSFPLALGGPGGPWGAQGQLPDPGPPAAVRRGSSSSVRMLPARPGHCFHLSPPSSICSCQLLRALLHGATDSSDFLLQICSGPSPPRSASLGPV